MSQAEQVVAPHAGQPTQAEQGTAGARVASTVIRVSELQRSVTFYCDVFSCRVALREPEVPLRLAPDGFQIYLSCIGQSRRWNTAAVGVQYLMRATDDSCQLERISQRLHAHDPATYAHAENGVTFVEGCEPDRGRVIVAYHSQTRLPRELMASRFRA
jgi:catechol 2,3-dioxygenase-like lactoylglutathione lyase family enzyme